MIEALEVKSIEDSRVMDASLSSTSTEGVQSTSRSWKRRLLLAVAPILGIALATGAIYNQVTAKPPDVVVPATGENPALAGKESEEGTELADKKLALIQTKFRQVLTDNAAPFAFNGGYFPFTPTSPFHPKEPTCGEDDFLGEQIPGGVFGPDSALALKLKNGFQYNPSSHFEPSALVFVGSCRCWSYFQPKFYAKQGNASTDPVQVVAALWLMRLPTQYWDEFEDLYLKARPGALMVTDPDAQRYPDVVGLGRPAVRARSLFDLPWELVAGTRGFYHELAQIVHSALSQLPSFYEATAFKFHGGISAHTLEVVLDKDFVPATAYVASYAEAIRYHIWFGEVVRDFDSTWDTWCAGVAMANSLAQYVAILNKEEKVLTDTFEGCNIYEWPVERTPNLPEKEDYQRIRSKALELCDEALCDSSFKEVLGHMLEKGLWTIPTALGKLEPLILEYRVGDWSPSS